MKKNLLSLFLLVQLNLGSFAQTIDATKLDAYFNMLQEHHKLMGSVAISIGGKVAYTKAVGYSDIASQKAADTQTRYRIGSISKTFTAVMVFKAIEAGKIKLTDPLSSYFPQVKNGEKIVVAQLLNHSSGIPNFTADRDYPKIRTKGLSPTELFQMVTFSASDFSPGEKHAYSNSNYLLLSLILEKIHGKGYPAILQEQITDPIGLKNTYYGRPTNIAQHESHSYIRSKGSWENQIETNMSVPLGAGAIVSTPGDLNLFASALYHGKLVSPESLKAMETIQSGYGMGLFRVPFYQKSGYGHRGNINGFAAFFYHFADGDVSVAMTANGVNINTNDIAMVLLNAAFQRPFQLPDFNPPSLTTHDLDKYLGVYASKELPLELTVTKKGNVLVAQATGQSAFELLATGNDKFGFEKANISMEFQPTNGSLIMTQGKKYLFTRE